MDAKITLSFDEKIIEMAKEFAAQQNISLSRLTEYLYAQITSGDYKTLGDMPVSDWISILAEDISDFYFSAIPVLNSQEFVGKCFK
jgi:hypothetical protein